MRIPIFHFELKDTFGMNIRTSLKMSVISKFSTMPVRLWLAHILLTSFFSMLMFVLIADYVGNPEVTVSYVAIGNAVQSVAITTMRAIAEIPNREKHAGTLPPLMAAPSNLFEVFLGMAIFNILAGLISAGCGLIYAGLIFNVDFSMANIPMIVLVIFMTTLSMTGLGMTVGGLGLHLRTANILANVASYVGIVLCGVNFPITYLPEWVQIISRFHPLTYAVEATRKAVTGEALGEIAMPMLLMAALGLVFLVVSMVFFKFFEEKSKEYGTLDAF